MSREPAPKFPIAPALASYGGHVQPDYDSGKRWRPIRCHLHDDKQASAQINTYSQRWCCFGCGLNEDAIAVIMREEGVPFARAVEIAEGVAGTGHQPVRAASGGRRRLSGGAGDQPGDGEQLAFGLRRRSTSRSRAS